MKTIRLFVWAATFGSTALLFVASNSGCACAPVPRSEPVAQLIDFLESEDKVAVIDAQERLRAVTGKKFKTRQQWQTWYDKKVDTILKQLDEGDTTRYALLQSRKYRRLIESLEVRDAVAARKARERLEALTGQRFNTKEDWEKWLKEEVDRLQAKRASEAATVTTDAFIHAGRYKIAEAVPVLERYMARYSGTGLTYAFLAAQALYLIGTPEAHETLKEYLPREDYDVAQSVPYMYHFWFMPRNEIDSFIMDYHLTNTSDKLAVELACTGKYDFKLSITNASTEDIQIYNHGAYEGYMLLLRCPDGHFAYKTYTVMYQLQPLKPYVALKPGESKVYDIACKVEKTRGLKGPYGYKKGQRYEVTEDYMLNTGDVAHFLPQQGEYEVYAVYSFPKKQNPYKPWPKNLNFGRWVSEPIKVKIEW